MQVAVTVPYSTLIMLITILSLRKALVCSYQGALFPFRELLSYHHVPSRQVLPPNAHRVEFHPITQVFYLPIDGIYIYQSLMAT